MKELKDMMRKNNISDKLLINFNKALKDPEFKNLVDKLGLSYEELSKYTSILEESKCEFCNCKNCKSILECKNKVNGYAYLPEVKNNSLSFAYKKCKYKREIDDKNKYLKNVYTYDIPEDIRSADIKEIHKTKNRFDVIKYVGNFKNEYFKDKHLKGLYLHGNFGCGKTYIISALLNELAKENIKSAVIFWPEYLRMLKSTFNDTDSFKINFEKIKTSPILLIDDIGAENVTPWSRDEILCSILQYRMEEHLPTFFTSNLTIEELEHHLASSKEGASDVKARRIIERIKQLTTDLEMIGKNLRN
ncbi:MAG: primosomal protein DnaI [Bacilli bacterium]|nr:primosomal protein DnaI [Bacilli bacterium]